MTLSREAKLVSGITLIAVPTIAYGGATLLGILTEGTAGIAPSDLNLDETQWALWRAGHAHAGVWLLFSLVIQVLLDSGSTAGGVALAHPDQRAAVRSRRVGRLLRVGVRSGLSVVALFGSVGACRRRPADRDRAATQPTRLPSRRLKRTPSRPQGLAARVAIIVGIY
ncbi:MAG: hypothetical protein ABEK03_02070 [Candidatus Bipolaricaulia bacterium]